MLEEAAPAAINPQSARQPPMGAKLPVAIEIA
jgi:hypothetical protein